MEYELHKASSIRTKQNISNEESSALSELQSDFSIVIREADKGSATVVMDLEYYLATGRNMLNCDRYKQLDLNKSQAIKLLRKVRKSHLTEFHLVLLKKEVEFLTEFDEDLAHMYLNPKVHKSQTIIEKVRNSNSLVVELTAPEDLPFRPITSGTKCPLKRLSTLVNKLLEPFPAKVKSFTKDTWDLLRKLPSTVEPGTSVVSLDVKDLYTNIDNDLGLRAVEYYVDKFPDELNPRLGKQFLLKSLAILQQNILFEFNGTIYQQLNGTAMGKDYGPPWATLAVGYLEETKLYPRIRSLYPPITAEKLIELYRRYQDDTLILNQFKMSDDSILDLFNNLHPQLKFTIESSSNTLPFLDVIVKINGCNLTTSIFHKETDSFNHLHFASNHPHHTKKNIPYSLARRIKGIVTNKKERFDSYINLRARLLQKSYPKALIKDALLKAERTPREKILNIAVTEASCRENCNTLTTMVTTHHQTLDKTAAKLTQLAKKANVSCLSGKRIIHSKRQPPNLKRLLTRTNTFKKPLKVVWSCKEKKCGLCFNGHDNIMEGSQLKLKNGKILKPNRFISCNSGNLVYCIICPHCQEFYIGECKNLRKRMNLHRNHSNPDNRSAPPLKINQHLKQYAGGYFHVFPFFIVPTQHQISRESYEKYFQDLLKPTLH